MTSRAQLLLLVPLTMLSACLAACGSEDSASDPDAAPVFDSTYAAPDPSRYSGSDLSPGAEDAVVRLELADGGEVALWIDPDDFATVHHQHSDPDDPDAWTSPEVLYSGGDGCLFIRAATDGEVVAATLGCYETDVFLQQAPDQGQAVASSDLVTWDVRDAGELYETPTVADGRATWDGFSWTAFGGFD